MFRYSRFLRGSSFHAPSLMGIDSRKPVTVRLESELYMAAWRDADRRKIGDGDPRMGPFAAWCVRQIVKFDFLSPENREFLQGMLRELGPRWHTLDLIDVLITTVRKEMREGRVRPTFWSGQIKTPKKSEAQ